MAASEEISVVYKNVDEVVSRLRSLAETAKGISKTNYALAITTGSAGTALVDVGNATNAFATKLSALITRTADRIEEAKAEYENVDFSEASKITEIGTEYLSGSSGGGSEW